MKKNEITLFVMSIITFHRPIWVVFPQLPWMPIVSRVFPPFHIQTTSILTKIKRLICSQQGLNPQPLNHKTIAQPIHICDNSSNLITTSIYNHTKKHKSQHIIDIHRTRKQVLSHNQSTLNHLS